MDALLAANPKARKQEKVVREAMREIEKLRQGGFAGRGYSLTPPFGEKRQALQRSRGKLTLTA